MSVYYFTLSLSIADLHEYQWERVPIQEVFARAREDPRRRELGVESTSLFLTETRARARGRLFRGRFKTSHTDRPPIGGSLW